MKNIFINISGDKSIEHQSPIPIFAFVVVYLISAFLMKLDLMFVIVVVFEFILCQVMFQYEPRLIYLTFLFISKYSEASPSFEDRDYVIDEYSLKNLVKLLEKK